jgi:hypothetical protein
VQSFKEWVSLLKTYYKHILVKCNLEDLSVTVDDKTLQNMHDTTTTQEDAPEFEPHVTAQNQTVQEEVPVVKDTRKGEPEEDLWFASLQFLARSCFSMFLRI